MAGQSLTADRESIRLKHPPGTPLSPLSHPTMPDGDKRRVGTELEFAHLDEDRAARCVVDCFGGTSRTDDGRVLTEVPELGTFEIYLDTAIGAGADPDPVEKLGRELGRSVIPVELVTPPLDFDAFARLPDLATALAQAGATGSQGGVLYGFGMHLNVQIREDSASHVGQVLTAFALLEDWLRGSDPIDPSRRVLPFVDPYPRALVDALAARSSGWDWDELFDLYLTHSPTRNRALDLLPILAWKDEDRVRSELGDDVKIGARPAYHYRLPDCRIGDPDWSIAQEWDKWRLVEAVSDDAAGLSYLSEAWQRYRDDWTTVRGDWRSTVGAWLVDTGHLDAD